MAKKHPPRSRSRPNRSKAPWMVASSVAAVALSLLIWPSVPNMESETISPRSDLPDPESKAGRSAALRRVRAATRTEGLPEEDRELLVDVVGRYPPSSVRCGQHSEHLDYDAIEHIRYFGHGSVSLGNPTNPPASYSPPYPLLEDLESARSHQTLFDILDHLDTLDIVATDRHGKTISIAESYLLSTDESREGRHFDARCLQTSGEAYLLATRAIIILIDRAMEGELGLSEAADRMPHGFQEIFYERLCIRLFEDDASFSPELAHSALAQLSDGQRRDLFDSLFPFVFINPSYRETASRVLEVSEDDDVRAGLGRVLRAAEGY